MPSAGQPNVAFEPGHLGQTRWLHSGYKLLRSAGSDRLAASPIQCEHAARDPAARGRNARAKAARLRDLEPACRAASRSGHAFARGADLPDHLVPVRRRRSCRRAVQPRARRAHLHAHLQSDDGGARGAPRRARAGGRRGVHGERHGGDASRHRDARSAPATTSSPRPRSTAAPSISSPTRCRASASPRASSSRAISTASAPRSAKTPGW